MDEYYGSAEFKTLIDAVQGLIDIDDELLTDEAMGQILENINNQFGPQIISQSVNEIIQNLENQNATKEDARTAINALDGVLKEILYGERVLTPNKKRIVDTVYDKLKVIFDTATNKYHSYNITLPMTLEEGAQMPTYAHESDAAADMYAMEDVTLPPHFLGTPIKTGVHIQLPEGWAAFILPRSSIGAKTPLRLSNSMGVIDSGYRGEIRALYDNIGDEPYEIHKGDRIAQMLVMPSYRFQPKIVESLEDSDRGEGGFGSTGT